jgi:hypothetical protein
VDVGSGYGKVVLHAALAVPGLAASHGVEYVPSRAATAASLLVELRSDDSPATHSRLAAALARCELRLGDACAPKALEGYSHVYMYDKVFSEATSAALARRLQASGALRVLCSYRPLADWARWGLTGMARCGSVRMSTTGGQTFTVHVFARMGPESGGR